MQTQLSLKRDHQADPKHRGWWILPRGEYRVQYYPCGAAVSFQVTKVQPVVERIARARASWAERLTEKARRTGQPDRCAGVLRVGDEYVTVALDGPAVICDEPPRPVETLTTGLWMRELAHAPKVASVRNDGVVTAVAPGTVNIRICGSMSLPVIVRNR